MELNIFDQINKLKKIVDEVKKRVSKAVTSLKSQ